MTLAEVQARFYALVTARDGVAATVAAGGPDARGALETMVAGDARLPAIERLEIYADMYFARIRDVLAEEYPQTLAALGAAVFQELAADYLAACRPNHPSLREVGARLPAFLGAHATADERPWLAELARLERARLELFDGPDAEALTLEALRARPPAQLAALRLCLVPSHALVPTRFDVAALWRGDAPSDRDPAPNPTTLIVWRRENDVFHRAAGSAAWPRARSASTCYAASWRSGEPTRRPPPARSRSSATGRPTDSSAPTSFASGPRWRCRCSARPSRRTRSRYWSRHPPRG
jgi:hypothetical protein